MILAWQTNVPGQLAVWVLRPNGTIFAERVMSIGPGQSDQLLAMVDGLLRKSRVRWPDIKKIIVVRGPGPFSPVRTGLVVANTLNYARSIPVVGLQSAGLLSAQQLQTAAKRRGTARGKFVTPAYGRAPNITKTSKKRRLK